MSKPLRVLSISTLFPSPSRPGFGLFVAKQMTALAARDDIELVVVHPVSLLPWPLNWLPGRSALNAIPDFYEWDGVPVFTKKFRKPPFLDPLLGPLCAGLSVGELCRQLHKRHPFDVVDAQFFFPDGPIAAQVARSLDLPLSIKARGSDIHYWGCKPQSLGQMVGAADRAAGLLAVSGALKADMIALGMDPAKIAVHYTGLDGATFHPRPRAEARQAVADLVPADDLLIVSVGNLIPLKGHDLVIRAMAALPGVRLAIAGKGPQEANLRSLAVTCGVADRVHVLGSLPPPRLAELLCAAQCMVLPSEREGLANAWIEALACGTPLVITDVGGAREVVRDAVAGRLVERNPTAIAEGIRAVLAAPPSPKEVAQSVSQFSWDANAAQLAEHYRRISG